jgi:hypothetical protein
MHAVHQPGAGEQIGKEQEKADETFHQASHEGQY